MSQYTCFYIKSPKNEYLPLGTFCRSSSVARHAYGLARYEEGRPFTDRICESIIREIEDDIAKIDKCIKDYEEQNAIILTMNNSVEEKMSMIWSINENIDDLQESKGDEAYALGYYRTLMTIIDDIPCTNLNKDDYIYFGVEWDPNYSE